MVVISKRAKRCSKCKRIIRASNKSGFCSFCGIQENAKERKRKSCNICEERCSGNLLIEVVKGRYVSLCTSHFNLLNLIDDPTELRKRIKYLRSYH